MTDIERALAQISDIRVQLAASTRFRGYAPDAAWVVPGIWLLVALVAFSSLAILPQRILWGGVMFLLAGTTEIVLAGQSR